jgi:23S rRNA pseudouridine1911/1915/1917 synthase
MHNYREDVDISKLNVLYEDNHIIAVYKPSNLLVQGDSTGEATLIDIVRKYLAVKYNKSGNVFLGMVHRLDKPACGIVLFGRTSKGASRLSEQFRTHNIKKIYRAVVEAKLNVNMKQKLKDNLIRKGSKSYVAKTDSEKKEGQEAELIYKVIETKNDISLLEIELITGRKHQIRTQLSHKGMPVMGDKKYGSKKSLPDKNAIALLSYKMTFTHPTKKNEISVTAEIPDEWGF